MADKKVYSTTVLGSGPRKAQGSAEVSGVDNGNVEYKNSKSRTPLNEEQKKGARSGAVAAIGILAGTMLGGAMSRAARDYEDSRRYRNRKAGGKRIKIMKPDNIQ